MLYFWKYKNSKFAQIWAYLDHGKCFQDAPDLSQIQPDPVAKAKQIQQKAPLFQGPCWWSVGNQQMYNLERFYGTKVGFCKGTDLYKSYILVQTCYFSMFLMP